jgi:hypothetical protein
MIQKDLRCIKTDDLIIITNYKCMFSSLSKLKREKVFNNDLLKYKVIFVYRDPTIRLISCFLHWGIRSPLKKKKDQQGNIGGWLLKEFKNNSMFDYQKYNNILEKELTEQNLIELFKQFLYILPEIYTKNKHLQPQSKILQDYGIDVSIYVDSDNNEDVNKLEVILNKRLRVCNKSDLKQKQLLKDFLNNDNEYLRIVKEIYEDDIELISSINSI